MRGEWIMKVLSTPTPCVTRRTVKFWRRPPPVTRITVPSNTCIRSRVPSTTLACTLTVSPALSAGTFCFCCSFSSCWITFMSSSTPLLGAFGRGADCPPPPAQEGDSGRFARPGALRGDVPPQREGQGWGFQCVRHSGWRPGGGAIRECAHGHRTAALRGQPYLGTRRDA